MTPATRLAAQLLQVRSVLFSSLRGYHASWAVSDLVALSYPPGRAMAFGRGRRSDETLERI